VLRPMRPRLALSWSDVRKCVAAAFVMLLSSYHLPAKAGRQQTEADAAALRHFDIPAQPLLSALERFGDIAGRELLYDAQLAEGRASTAVSGDFSPSQALQILLGNTGLIAKFSTETAIVIVPAAKPAAGNTQTLLDQQADNNRLVFANYYGLVQGQIRHVFCDKALLQPGEYRAAAQIWIAPSGGVQRASLLESTGDRHRDSAIIHALADMHMGGAPPAGFAQPFTLVIRPQASARSRDCTAADRSVR
jgi:hypothetical protein